MLMVSQSPDMLEQDSAAAYEHELSEEVAHSSLAAHAAEVAVCRARVEADASFSYCDQQPCVTILIQ